MEPRHERIAKVALAAGARYGLALAGGYAVQAHGMGSRPSGDVDLFTSWQHRGEFPELTAAVIAALDAAGYTTTVIMQADTFALPGAKTAITASGLQFPGADGGPALQPRRQGHPRP